MIMLRSLAAQEGLSMFVGGMLETGVGRAHALAYASHPCCDLPTDLGPSAQYFEHDLVPPVVLDADHRLVVPRGPGIGVSPDMARLDGVTRAQVERRRG